LHEEFIEASHIRDPARKRCVLSELVFKLPPEHLHTAKLLMMHLHRVSKHSEVNLMTARNLGVVFGRESLWLPHRCRESDIEPLVATLMRSQDAGAEFSDMAGKSLTVEWLVENAPTVFDFNSPSDS
jgi:hypothetical protein